MRSGLILRKIGMTRVFSNDGVDTPVTILKLDNVQVVNIRNQENDGYNAIQIGAGAVKTKNLTKPLRGYFAKLKVEPKKILREFVVEDDMKLNIGDTFSANHFVVGQKVDASGISIGKGFSGAMKRHNFSGLGASHGVSISHRSHGSTGNSQDPGRVWKGKKMAGQYGNVKKTIQNLSIVNINEENDLIFVKGSIPGPKNSYVLIKDATKSKLPEAVLKPAGLKKDTISDDNQQLVKNKEVSDKEKLEKKDQHLDHELLAKQNSNKNTTEISDSKEENKVED